MARRSFATMPFLATVIADEKVAATYHNKKNNKPVLLPGGKRADKKKSGLRNKRLNHKPNSNGGGAGMLNKSLVEGLDQLQFITILLASN